MFSLSNLMNIMHARQSRIYKCLKPLVNYKRAFIYSSARRDSSSATSKLFEDTRVTKNVLLFKYENNRFFRILNIFAFSQFIFWTYLAHFSYTTLRDISKEDAERQLRERLGEAGVESVRLVWWRRVNFGDNKYRYGITVLCASIGYIILTGAVLFTKRSVKYLTLMKGGQHVQLTCYSPFWRDHVISVPLDHLSCNVSREHSKGQVPVKIKNYWMYFLIDKSGTFTNTRLFDYTAGVKRVWAKKL